MARALAEQQALPDIARLPFEERLGLLVEREVSERESRLTSSRLRRAKLKQAAVGRRCGLPRSAQSGSCRV
jgi:hypothetical protein